MSRIKDKKKALALFDQIDRRTIFGFVWHETVQFQYDRLQPHQEAAATESTSGTLRTYPAGPDWYME